MKEELINQLKEYTSLNYIKIDDLAFEDDLNEECALQKPSVIDIYSRKEQISNVKCDMPFDNMYQSQINELDNTIKNNKEKTFQEQLFEYIDARGKSDSEVYNSVHMDRRLFSKIRSNKNYQPSKRTVFSFCIALKLDMEESKHLLQSAGYAFSNTRIDDVIIRFFIEKEYYDILDINEALSIYNEPSLY